MVFIKKKKENKFVIPGRRNEGEIKPNLLQGSSDPMIIHMMVAGAEAVKSLENYKGFLDVKK